jgi:SulP family sulfate permease
MAWLTFQPKLLQALEGYNSQRLGKDISAGLTVGVVALPLAMAFAIASGLKPEAGLFTAIVAGFLISALGGSKVQIGGPAGAFIVIVYGIVSQHGVTGLMLATLLSGVWLLLMGLLRLGVLIRFIPVAVIIGFTNGIAVLIMLSQMKDFFGLHIHPLPADFFHLVASLVEHANSLNTAALALALASLGLLVFWQRLLPKVLPEIWAKRWGVIPGSLLVLVLSTLATVAMDLPIDTMGSRFGGIPDSLPTWVWPSFHWSQLQAVLLPSITLGLLGGVESLLCARVTDKLTHDRHDPNQELMAQGIANIAVTFIGGMPATGTIARTMTNVNNGASSPIAGMVHALGLLLVMLLAAPLAFHVPLAALSAILVFVAWNMGEWHAFIDLQQFRWPYRLTLLAVFGLTVTVDLSVAVAVGLVAATLTFLFRISSLTRSTELHRDAHTQVHQLQGALFFGAVTLVEKRLDDLPRHRLVLDAAGLIYIDSSGADALDQLFQACQQQGVLFQLAGLRDQPLDILQRCGLLAEMGEENCLNDAQALVKTLAG